MFKRLFGHRSPRELSEIEVGYLAEQLSLTPFAIDLQMLNEMRLHEWATLTMAQRGSLLAELRLLGVIGCLYSLYEPAANLSKPAIVRTTSATAERFVSRPFFTPAERAELGKPSGDIPEWMIYDLPDAKPMLFNQRYEWYCALWPNPAALASSEAGAKAAIQTRKWGNLEGLAGLSVPLVMAVGMVLRLMLPSASEVLKHELKPR